MSVQTDLMTKMSKVICQSHKVISMFDMSVQLDLMTSMSKVMFQTLQVAFMSKVMCHVIVNKL